MISKTIPTIVHVDMDAFFASVEQARDPSLIGKPVIVGGRTERRGVVCAASYEARRFGVHSAMPLVQARRLCPRAIFLKGSGAVYAATSRQVMGLLETVSPLVEPLSLDEAYVDVTGSQRLFGAPQNIADLIRRRIRAATALPASVGISVNKLVAKVATDEAKPDGVFHVPAGQERSFLGPLDVRKLPGVGQKTSEILHDMGIRTINHLAAVSPDALMRIFGRHGYVLQRRACGIDSDFVNAVAPPPKSISREITFDHDHADWSRLRMTITYLAERALFALRKHNMETRRVTLKVRFSDFKTITLARTMPEPTQLDTEILAALADLTDDARDRRRARVRLIGVCLNGLTRDHVQLSLFSPPNREKWRTALAAVDEIRNRYDFDTIRTARSTMIRSLHGPSIPAPTR